MSLPTTYNLLAKYSNYYYVETGMWRGDSLLQAYDAGFQRCYGMDVEPNNVRFVTDRFDLNNPESQYTGKIIPGLGNSAWALSDFLRAFCDDAITFFLDAHAQHIEGEPEYEEPFPLLDELEQIAQSNINKQGSVIIIDDILHLTHPDITGWNRELIEKNVRRINKEFKITYVANPVKNNILIAHL